MPAPETPAPRISAARATAERRRAPGREARSASYLERMEFAGTNVDDPADIDGTRGWGP